MWTSQPFQTVSSYSLVSFSVSSSVKQAGMEQPALPEATSSTHGAGEVSKTTVTELTSPDGKVTQIENIVDLWSGSLKVFILYGILKNHSQISLYCRASAGEVSV